jgi:hypothetical protein
LVAIVSVFGSADAEQGMQEGLQPRPWMMLPMYLRERLDIEHE